MPHEAYFREYDVNLVTKIPALFVFFTARLRVCLGGANAQNWTMRLEIRL